MRRIFAPIWLACALVSASCDHAPASLRPATRNGWDATSRGWAAFIAQRSNAPDAKGLERRAMADAQAAYSRFERNKQDMASLYEAGILAYSARSTPEFLRDAQGRPVTKAAFAKATGYEFDLLRWLFRVRSDGYKEATFSEALAAGEALLKRDPNALHVLWWLCFLNVESGLGDRDRAVVLGERWRKIEPKSPWPEVWIASARARQLQVAYEAGKPLDARKAQLAVDGFRIVLARTDKTFPRWKSANGGIQWLTKVTPAK